MDPAALLRKFRHSSAVSDGVFRFAISCREIYVYYRMGIKIQDKVDIVIFSRTLTRLTMLIGSQRKMVFHLYLITLLLASERGFRDNSGDLYSITFPAFTSANGPILLRFRHHSSTKSRLSFMHTPSVKHQLTFFP